MQYPEVLQPIAVSVLIFSPFIRFFSWLLIFLYLQLIALIKIFHIFTLTRLIPLHRVSAFRLVLVRLDRLTMVGKAV